MSENQFGRVENLDVRAGQPLRGPATRVVRSSHLGGGSGDTEVPRGTDFELKRALRDLFAELERLDNGTVVRIEFRRGLPCLLETTLGTS
jgi:hypothetical protein